MPEIEARNCYYLLLNTFPNQIHSPKHENPVFSQFRHSTWQQLITNNLHGLKTAIVTVSQSIKLALHQIFNFFLILQ